MDKATQNTITDNGTERPDCPFYSTDDLMLGSDIRKPEDISPITYDDVKDFLTDEGMRTIINDLRSETEPEKRRLMKLQLPYIVTGIFKDARKNDQLVQMHGMMLDYDHLDSPDYYKEKVLPGLDFVQLAFTSPNGGLKVYIPFSIPVFSETDYRLLYRYLQKRCDEVLKLKSDATDDPARATFLSFDDKYYENREVNKVSPEITLQIAIAENVQRIVDMGVSPVSGQAGTHVPTPLCRPSLAGRPKEEVPASPSQTGHCFGTLVAGTTSELNGAELQDITSATEHCSKQQMNYADWVRFGMALKSALGENGKALWLSFLNNPHFPNEKQITLERHWASFKRLGNITYKTIFFIAKKYGWKVGTNASLVQGQTRASVPTDKKKLTDYPDLLELFGKHESVPLETDKLPGFLQDYLQITGEITDAQDGAKLSALLPVIASNIGNRIYMYNAGTQHFCNIWSAIIGPSTIARKTTVINLALKTIKRFQDSLTELTPKERNEQDITLTRVTQARLFNLLAKNPNRLIVQMELAAWMQEMNKTYNAGMKQDLTNMFDGRDMSIAKMEIDEYISKPAFSIIGATTEDWFFRELREVADQRGGFLQRFIICMVQNIDLESLNFNFRDNTAHDDRLYKLDEILCVFRSLPGSFRLNADADAIKYRDEAYAERMRASAMTGNDPMASYCSRMYDNYWFRFCIVIWMMEHWQDVKAVMSSHSCAGSPRCFSNEVSAKVAVLESNQSNPSHHPINGALPHTPKYVNLYEYFANEKVDITIAKQAMYLCDYYFENTKPFLASLSENAKLDGERKLIRILQKEKSNALTHSRLLNKSKMTSKEFRFCIESLIERQAIFARDWQSGNNKSATEYELNPVLNEMANEF